MLDVIYDFQKPYCFFQTANGITLALCDLALHPEKQATLFEEVSRVVGDSSHITSEQLNRMSYLKACMKESQR